MTWRNWAGNQVCLPRAVLRPPDLDALRATIADAAAAGRRVRVVGAGHSFTPLVCTGDLIVDAGALTGVADADEAARRATVWAGTTIGALGPLLWGHGLALRNQGDIDAQTVAGAVSTATHGSGLGYPSFSGSVHRIEYVSPAGALETVDDTHPDFDAFRTSLGTLGVLTRIGLDVAPAYQLRERIEYWPFAEVTERWADETSTRRHFSYFWGPRPGSLELYGFASAPAGMADGCYVKLYDELPPEAEVEPGPGQRLDRSYLIYASLFDTPFYELEYFVPFAVALAAVDAVREAMGRHPDQPFPLEVRTIGAETGWLSPMHGTDAVSISVSGAPGTDYWPFLHDVDRVLRAFGARPHWGKLHAFDRGRLAEVYPRFEDFVAVRRARDPAGTLLNDHLAALIG